MVSDPLTRLRAEERVTRGNRKIDRLFWHNAHDEFRRAFF